MRIFYSWQSDTDKKINDHFIRECIRSAIKKINKGSINIEIRLDHDTKDEAGIPNIVETILKKIRQSDIFICDVTLVNKNWLSPFFREKFTSNPNVLFELGYAVNSLGRNRIICINNDSISRVEELPFDIRQHRISCYRLKKKSSKEERKVARDHLTNTIKYAIEVIIENYDVYAEESRIKSREQHDIDLFKRIEDISTEQKLKSIIGSIVASKGSNSNYTEFFEELIAFSRYTGNEFLDAELQASFNEFILVLDEFENYCAKVMFPASNNPIYKYVDEDGKEKEVVRYSLSEHLPPMPYENYLKMIDNQRQKISKLSFIVTDKYVDFRKLIKNKLLI